MLRSNPLIGRLIQFVWIPSCYLGLLRNKNLKRGRVALAYDLLEIFYKYRTFPDNYGPCRLWELPKSSWKYYYGSNYHPLQRSKLQRIVQPREYAILFDDKMICDRLCRSIGVNLPATYGVVGPDHDYINTIKSWLDKSISGTLFIKPLRGSGGRGIMLAREVDSSIYVRMKNQQLLLNDLIIYEDMLVQESVEQDDKMAALSSESVNTMRIVTMLTKQDSIIILTAILRCGVGNSYVDNWSAGGVGVGIHLNTGQLKKFAFDKQGNRYAEHPTSRILFEGFMIPSWEKVIRVANIVQRSFPFYRILGMDIAIQKDGEPILIEVNDSPDLMGMEQMNGPLLQVGQNLRAFAEYDLLVNKWQEKLFKELA